jgi:hypothetical protein
MFRKLEVEGGEIKDQLDFSTILKDGVVLCE